MALRLPTTRRSIRRPSRGRRIATLTFSALVLTVLPIRILIAALSIATWTSSWRTIDAITMPFVWPLKRIGPLNNTIAGAATLADVLALLLFGGIAAYLLASLTVRRQQ